MLRKLRKAWLTTIVPALLMGGSASAQDTPVPPPPVTEPPPPAAPPPPQVIDPPPPDTAAPPITDGPSEPVVTEPAPPAPPPDEEIAAGAPIEEVVVSDADPDAAPKSDNGEILVTGSRIRRKDLTGPAPVVVFSREQILASGHANIGEFLQTMPEQSNAINRGTNNGGDSSIRVNLRGIGAKSTLVLLNGRRLAPGGTGADISVDLSAIPTNVIERIEILKDGASAVYGSDAIAGVVNIITKKRYEGAELNVYGSATTKRDGEQIDANGMVGASNDKGGVLMSLGYYNGAPVWAGNRDYSNVQRGLDLSGGGAGVPYDLGSGTIPAGRIVLGPNERGVQNGNSFYNSIARANPTASDLTRDPVTGMWRKFNGPNLPNDGGDGWNYQPYNYLVTPQQRFNVFSSGDYKLSKYVRVFYDSFYTKRNSAQTLAPEPLVLDTEGITVSGRNIYNPFGRDFDAVRRRLNEFGRRTTEQDIHNFHVTTGLDGDLPDSAGPLAGWFWEATFNYNVNESSEIKTGNLRGTKLRDAVGPSFVDATGTPRCGVTGSAIDGCVPLNLFGGAGSITQDQVAGLTYTGIQRGYNRIIGAQANTSGELFHLWSKNAVSLALGYEFRALSGGQIPDPITVAGETTGNKLLITKGSYNVNEVYGELSIPIVEKKPALEVLELTAAGRGSFYSNFGNTFNYKLGGLWSPTKGFAFRGTYSTAFRAPNISELYQGQADNFSNVSDPCGVGVTPGSALARNCGAATNNGDDQPQLRSRIGGNPNLQPEKAKIFTLGLVVQPRPIKNLSFTFDYFNTLVTQNIDGIGENTILQGCYPGADGSAAKYCEFVTRDPVTQRITNIINLNANTGEEHLDGVDMTGQYTINGPAGTFNLQGAVAYLHKYDRTLADGTVIHGAGTWDLNSSGSGGVGGAFPHFRFTGGVNWALKGFSAGVRAFFIGSYKECGDSTGDLSGPGLCYAPEHVGERWVSAYSTFDLVLGYSFRSGMGTTALSIGSTNLFNTEPPRVYNGFAATTDTYTYDMVMRQVYARLRQEF
jgi:iron complex outermembrane receptor protein